MAAAIQMHLEQAAVVRGSRRVRRLARDPFDRQVAQRQQHLRRRRPEVELVDLEVGAAETPQRGGQVVVRGVAMLGRPDLRQPEPGVGHPILDRRRDQADQVPGRHVHEVGAAGARGDVEHDPLPQIERAVRIDRVIARAAIACDGQQAGQPDLGVLSEQIDDEVRRIEVSRWKLALAEPAPEELHQRRGRTPQRRLDGGDVVLREGDVVSGGGGRLVKQHLDAQAVLDRELLVLVHRAAIASISTSAPLGRPAAWTVARAGGSFAKKRP